MLTLLRKFGIGKHTHVCKFVMFLAQKCRFHKIWGRKLWQILDLSIPVESRYYYFSIMAGSFTSQEEENPGRKELFELIKSSSGL